MELLPLLGRGWTNSPPLFNNWDDAGQPPPSPTWSHLGHLIAGIVSSWRSTERYEDFIFWKRSVSLCFLGVFLCCVCFGLCLFFCFDFGRHLAFCFSPVLEQRENSWSTTRRFDDRPSLERARRDVSRCGLEKLLVLPDSEELAFVGVSLPFPLPFSLPRPFLFPLPLGGALYLREIDILMQERGCKMNWRGTALQEGFCRQTWLCIEGLSRYCACRGLRGQSAGR